MSEIIDRPKIGVPPATDKAPVEITPPQRYSVQAWSNGHHCAAKFIMVVAEEFRMSRSTAAHLSGFLLGNPRVEVALGLTREVAEMQAGRANQKLKELVGDCKCGHTIEFVPVPM